MFCNNEKHKLVLLSRISYNSYVDIPYIYIY
jgi:hypothetical protein